MAVVVGFIPTDVGFKALDAAREEAELRGGPLIVVNVVREGVADDPRHADDGELDVANDRLRGSMVRVEIRQLHTDDDIADVLLDVVDSEQAERSEEHTSELQSRGHLVCRLLLEKK